MAFEPAGRWRAVLASALAASALILSGEAAGQTVTSKAQIYSCTLNGKRITRDRQIAECDQVDQRVMNSDGSVNRIVPPTLTEEQIQERDACTRETEADRVGRREASRRDRNLMQTYPDETSHRKSREKSLDDSRTLVGKSKERIEVLLKDRKPLFEEAEFYLGKPLPLKLKLALDANDAGLAAQKQLIQTQEAEVKRINDRYDLELMRLRKFWTDTPPGSFYVSPPLSAGCTKAASR